MKNFLFSTLAFLFLATAPAVAGSALIGEPLIVRSKLMEGGLEVLIANLEQRTATVILTNLDSKREVFYDAIRKHNGFTYSLNLDELNPGRYVLAVKKGKTMRRQVLVVSNDGVMCSDWN